MGQVRIYVKSVRIDSWVKSAYQVSGLVAWPGSCQYYTSSE